MVVVYDPSIYITRSHLSKPVLFILQSIDLCMMNASISQPEPVAVAMMEEGQTEDGRMKINVVREDGPSQGLDDLAALEEDIRWLSDEPDVDERSQPKQEQLETGIAVTAETVDNKGKLPDNTGSKNFAQELGSLCTADTEQVAALKRFEQERTETDQRVRKAKGPEGTDCVVNMGKITAEPDSCLSVAEGMCLYRRTQKASIPYGSGRVYGLWKEDQLQGEEVNILNRNLMTRIDLKQAGATQLIVATLVATVAFIAGFTMPGGYNGNDGPNQGMAILTREAAFKAFKVTNTIAMSLSTSAVLIHLNGAMTNNLDKLERKVCRAANLISYAAVAMVLAFVTGTYAVLAHSSGLAISVCVIGCFPLPFFLITDIRDSATFRFVKGIFTTRQNGAERNSIFIDI
ncbi:hypothetical protein TEA_000239 [Camellia sinensis var. sinensis]|uniref:PGG domain-containing protein n=1 Tax=Camellia sinensis var. sinensis TaxID=542762 RepID=A0A4S4DS22_CAMSN|nr:hypothetical protein TEA_000239 [Camellia sinensis var. sinensis]